MNRRRYTAEDFEPTADLFRRIVRRRRPLLIGIAGVVLVLWLASGIYQVQPGEDGVIRTFGRYTATTSPGLHYHLPWPVQTVTIVNVESIRRAEIGFRTEADGDKLNVLDEALMLTEDENIVQVELLVQYRVGDSRDFTFNVQDPESVLRTTAEVALRSTVGNMTIDAVITEERARVQDETRTFLKRLLDEYGSGILVTDVRLQVADPPEEVRDAFQEVVRARADKERLINEAQAYANDVVPRARGEKQQQIEDATAFKEQQELLATGDADRFLAVLSEYRQAPEVTRERMHIEALEAILNRVELILLDANTGNQVLPFLPLKDLGGSVPTLGDEPVPALGDEPVPPLGDEPVPPLGDEPVPPLGDESPPESGGE
ncbi:MAG: FtsH protease activity modulator HflK [Chloroflexota bacterium]|nr:MAG: FtsH protease activity modulator HflK [Chloroflexota bacterium]